MPLDTPVSPAELIPSSVRDKPVLGFGDPMGVPTAPGSSDFQLAQERMQREQKASAGDYLGSIWRQDGLADGMAASLAGRELAVDPDFNPYLQDPKARKELEAGLWPEFLPELDKAHSAAHQLYLKDRLLQKQEDLIRLGDMGWKGNVGRFALNAILPDQLLMSMVGGRVAQGVRAVELARAGKAATKIAAAEQVAGTVAAQASRGAGVKAVVAGASFGAAENAAYEAMRQSVNFEDDNGQLLEAGLMGAAFTVPFAAVGARRAAQLTSVAKKEHEVLLALRTQAEGGDLTPDQGKLILETAKVHDALVAHANGKISDEQLAKAVDTFTGPIEPPERWMQRYSQQIAEEGQRIRDTYFPGSDGKATGRPPLSEPQRAASDAAVALEDTNFAPPAPAPAPAPGKTAMELAFTKAKAESTAKRSKRAALRQALDIDEALAKQGDGEAKTRLDAFAQAEKDAAKARKAQEEASYNERELALSRAVNDDPLAPRDPQPEQPRVADPQAAPEVAPPPPYGWQATSAESFVGKAVSWTDRLGDEWSGKVKGLTKNGHLIVSTNEGDKAVAHTKVDQYEGVAHEGFMPGSVGAAQVGKVGRYFTDARTAKAEITVTRNGKQYSVPTRFDIYAVLNGSPSETVRSLGYRLVKDAIQNDKHEAQGMTASEWKKQLQRGVAGLFHVESQAAFREALKAQGIPVWNVKARAEFAHEFYGMVTRTTAGDTDPATAMPHLAPMLQKASAAQKRVYATMLQKMKDVGVKGAADVSPDDFYVNRVWNNRAIDEALAKHGDDAVADVIAQAIKDPQHIIDRYKQSPAYKANPTLTDPEILRLKAKRFLGAVRALRFSSAMQDLHLSGRDMGTLRRELDAMGVTGGQIDDLVDFMFEVKEATSGTPDAGHMAQLKFRFGLDEATKVTTQAGELRLRDLFENDARVLVDTYVNSAGGHYGLAKHGIRSQADFAAELKRAQDEALAMPGASQERIARDLALLEDVHRNITGRPMSTADFTPFNRAATAFRGYTRAVVLPQLGIASAFEMSKAVAMMGFKSLNQLPSFHSLLVGLRQGFIPDQGLARDLRILTGFGNEMASSYMRLHEIDSGFMGQVLTRGEQTANVLSHTVDLASGNASFTSLTKHLSSMMAAQQFADVAAGRKKLTPKLAERWVGQGLGSDDVDAVFAAFKKHTVEVDGRLDQVLYEDWHKDSPRTLELWKTFLSRQVRDAIQDHDLGETLPFMHTTLGKLFGELRTFFLVAHAKNMLKQVHFMDQTALQVWTIGFIGECLAYSTQAAINFPGELEERLKPETIAMAAFNRMSSLGFTSFIADTAYGLVTGESLVQPGMTANTDSRSIFRPPSVMVAQKLGNAFVTGSNALLGTDVTTRKEFRDAVSALPVLPNLYGGKVLVNWWAETLPKSDPEKPGAR